MQDAHNSLDPLPDLPYPLMNYMKKEMPLSELIKSDGHGDLDITCELAEIEEHIKSRELLLNSAKIEVEAAQEDAKTSKAEAETLRKQVDELQKLLTCRADNYENAIKSNEELKSRLSIQDKQIEELRHEIMQSRANYTKASTELRAYKQQATEAGVELEQLRADKQRLEKMASESKAFEEKAQQLESQMELLKRQHAHQTETLERKLEDALFQIESLSSTRSGNNVVELQSEVDKLKKENEMLKKGQQAMKREISANPVDPHNEKVEQIHLRSARAKPRRSTKETDKRTLPRPAAAQPSLAMIASKSTAFASGELPDLDF